MKRILFLLYLVCFSVLCFGQMERGTDLTKWSFSSQKINDSTFNILIDVAIKKGYHIYSFDPGGDGLLVPPAFTFNKNPNVRFEGKVSESGKIISEEVKELDYTIRYFKDKATYTQKAIVRANTTIRGNVYFSVCDDQMCTPPETLKFSVDIDGLAQTAVDDTTQVEDTTEVIATSAQPSATDTTVKAATAGSLADGTESLEKSSLWELFIAGFVAGFIAFIMPCIYAMLPITVSFFTKRSKNRATGIKNAIFYSLSIILIFTAIGALVTLLFSEKTMYELSTSMGFNLFVFILFIVFGVSLLGAFEITLPASWSSKLDSKSNTNSFGGIFFMALVLVIVSFSCTSAFISSLIVYIVKSQNSLGGLVGFFGFGLAIALPFALCAFFPGLLNNIAKSGGWLNTVKVSMGFIELAMAMKFLSNIDLQYHWRLLDFEVYLSIWIIIFALLGFYLLGKLRFSHDDDLPKNMFGQTYISVTRLFFAMSALAFSVYMIPGLWGAPLTGISGFLPERKTLDFNIHDNLINLQASGGVSAGNDAQEVRPQKYADRLKSELPGIATFFDYDEALAAAKKMNKPVLLDFTGHSCVNCRKMERAVLSKPEVLRELKQHFVVASLYCDDKTKIAEAEFFKSSIDGATITTIGGKNLELEITRFGAVAQPLYIFVDPDGNVIRNAGGFVPDVQRFLNIMDEVRKVHAEHK
jgi:thiol:disulfide interchange protein